MLELPIDLVNDHVFVRATMNGVPLDRVRRSLREAGQTRVLGIGRLKSVPLPLRRIV